MDSAINGWIIKKTEELNTRSVGAFWAFDGEPDLRPSMEILAAAGVTVGLPVLHGSGPTGMDFRAWRNGCPMPANRYGIPEPAHERLLPLRQLDLILVPLVAWDRRGNRLGMGAGLYDRTLRLSSGSGGPLLAGVGYGPQEQNAVPVDDRDVRLQAIVCEAGWYIIEP